MRSGNTAGAALRSVLCLLALCGLSACAGSGASTSSHYQVANRYAGSPAGRSHVRNNTPPGSADDPWGPYIKEASARFGMPEGWIRQVIRVESGGHSTRNGVPTTSAAGAMGLMQVMPGTYGDLKIRYNLGDDPYDPHDNIIGGTAYLREMYDRFGSPNFLAAYNAGPHRVDQYLAGSSDLPAETVNYVAMIAPNLDGAVFEAAAPVDGGQSSDPNVIYASQTGITGPIVQTASASRPAPVQVAAAATPAAPAPAPAPQPDLAPIIEAAAMEPEPSNPAQPAPAAVARPSSAYPAVAYQTAAYQATSYQSAAYQSGPSHVSDLVQEAQRQAPARSEPRLVLIQSPRPPMPAPLEASSGARVQLASSEAGFRGGEGSATWAIQVGAYTTTAQANAAAAAARSAGGSLLKGSATSVGVATRSDGSVLYRARLAGLTEDTAQKACGVLSGRQIACASVPPA